MAFIFNYSKALNFDYTWPYFAKNGQKIGELLVDHNWQKSASELSAIQ